MIADPWGREAHSFPGEGLGEEKPGLPAWQQLLQVEGAAWKTCAAAFGNPAKSVLVGESCTFKSMLPSTPDPNVALTFLEKTREKVCWKLLSVCFACEQAGRQRVCDACAGEKRLSAGI